MSRSPWFDAPSPRILAHRGLALAAPENSVEAFRAADATGATHLETDVRTTVEGVAVLVHDERLVDGSPVERLTLAALRQRFPGVATLPEALRALPSGRFNLDIKAQRAVQPVVAAVRDAGAVPRVLVTSFSPRRRLPAVRRLPGVATSGSSTDLLAVLLALRLGPAAVRRALAGVDALQVPQYALGTDLGAPPFLQAVRAAGAEVHLWVVNEPERMRALVAAGANGIVTDRPDVAADALR